MTAPYRYMPAKLTAEQRVRLDRADEASRRVWKLFSPPVARVLAESLNGYIEFGSRFSVGTHAEALIADILSRPLPKA